MGDDFEFGGVGAGVFEGFHAAMQFERLVDGPADRPVVRPGDMPRYHAEMTDDRNAFAGHGFDDERAGRAIDGAGPDLERAEGDADGFLRRGEAVRGGAGEKAIRRRRDEVRQACLCFRTVEAATHEVHAGFLGGGGFLGRFHVDMREATFALELLKIVDGVLFARPKHGEVDG